jgi:acetolactate synthase-1/2/3 large subunit
VLGVKMAHPHRAASSLVGDGGFSANPSVVATAMEAELAGRLARHGQRRVRHDRRPRADALRLELRCLFERKGEPYRADYAAMARSFGARGVMINSADELGPALRDALASDLPTVIQAPMENAPTPTPGHWDINAVYRRGE